MGKSHNNIEKIRNIDSQKLYHLLILVLVLCIIILSFLFRLRKYHVVLPIINVELGPICLIKIVTGYNCPFCGMSRSFVSASSLDFSSAIRYNLAGPLLYIICLLNIPYRIVVLNGFDMLSYSVSKYLIYCFFILTFIVILANFVLQFF